MVQMENFARYVENCLPWLNPCYVGWGSAAWAWLGPEASPLWVGHSSKGKKEKSGCKDCKGLANCHIIMECVNLLRACSRPVSCSCELHSGGSSTCVTFSPPS